MPGYGSMFEGGSDGSTPIPPVIDGVGRFTIDFDLFTSSPLDFGPLLAGQQIIEAQVVIDQPFDDIATLISLGTVSAPDTILPTNTIDPLTSSTYMTEENVLVAVPDQMRFKLNPAASTQGSGRVVVLFV